MDCWQDAIAIPATPSLASPTPPPSSSDLCAPAAPRLLRPPLPPLPPPLSSPFLLAAPQRPSMAVASCFGVSLAHFVTSVPNAGGGKSTEDCCLGIFSIPMPSCASPSALSPPTLPPPCSPCPPRLLSPSPLQLATSVFEPGSRGSSSLTFEALDVS